MHSAIYKTNKIWFYLFVAGMIFFWGVSISAAPSTQRRSAVVLAVEKVSPAVVNISTVVHGRMNPMVPFSGDDFFKDFFEDFFTSEYTYNSLGSGVIIDGVKGYIITNHHVVAGSTKIKVITADKQEFEATIMGSDPRSDLAVLKVNNTAKLPALEMGRSDDLMIGETVIAIGNPFGFSHTVTTGVVSALDRTIRTEGNVFRHFIQTDASINPGNSGGPLLNLDGDLIGINTAIYQKAQGIGFAIPIDKAKRIIKELLKSGEVRMPWLGLEVQKLTPELRKSFDFKNKNGVLISDVIEESPGSKADLKLGDILVAMGGTPVSDLAEYRNTLAEFTLSDRIELRIFRNGKESSRFVEPVVFPIAKTMDLVYRRLGLKVEEADRGLLNRYGLQGGIMIQKIKAGSEAERIGLRQGDLIIKINEAAVKNLEEFKKAISRLHHLPSLTLIVRRGPYAYSLILPF